MCSVCTESPQFPIFLFSLRLYFSHSLSLAHPPLYITLPFPLFPCFIRYFFLPLLFVRLHPFVFVLVYESIESIILSEMALSMSASSLSLSHSFYHSFSYFFLFLSSFLLVFILFVCLFIFSFSSLLLPFFSLRFFLHSFIRLLFPSPSYLPIF